MLGTLAVSERHPYAVGAEPGLSEGRFTSAHEFTHRALQPIGQNAQFSNTKGLIQVESNLASHVPLLQEREGGATLRATRIMQ